MTWLPITDLLLKAQPERQVALEPALHHPELRERALRLAAALQALEAGPPEPAQL